MFKFLKNLFGRSNKKSVIKNIIPKSFDYDEETIVSINPITDDTVSVKVGSTRNLTQSELEEIIKHVLKREGLADV